MEKAGGRNGEGGQGIEGKRVGDISNAVSSKLQGQEKIGVPSIHMWGIISHSCREEARLDSKPGNACVTSMPSAFFLEC